MYDLTVKTDNGSEPIDESTIKNFIKYDESNATEITLINDMVKAARQLMEQYLNRSLKEKTYELSFDYLSIDDDYTMRIPYGPFVTLNSFKWYDDGKSAETLTENKDFYIRGKYFKLLYLPTIETTGYYVLDYDSGHGANSEALPEVLELAIMETVFDWYENRGQNKEWNLPESVKIKINAFRKQYYI